MLQETDTHAAHKNIVPCSSGRNDTRFSPHSTRGGSYDLTTISGSVHHSLTALGFAARFNAIRKRLELRRAQEIPVGQRAAANWSALVDYMNALSEPPYREGPTADDDERPLFSDWLDRPLGGEWVL